MGFAFYSFCAISVLLLVGCITPPISSVKAASQDSYLSSEILNASELEDEPSVNFMVEHKPPSFVPYITLSLGLFSAALSVNYYCQKPIHFNNLTTPELVDVLMTKDEVIREIKRRLEPSKRNIIRQRQVTTSEEFQVLLQEQEKRLTYEVEQRLKVCKKSTRYRREAILAKRELQQLQAKLSEIEAQSFVPSL